MSLRVDAHQWPAISALLDEALALAPGERDTFVQSLSGEHAQYRDTLRALLAQAAGVETEDFLATLPRFTRIGGGVEPGQPSPLAELAAGEAIGPYRLLSELGTGGMGAVWLAERSDGTLKRKVALKLPRLVWARGLAERMARERDILASLEHPHIARLYDAGVDQHGRPYLALEYVEGQPIDAYARERSLPVRQKLDLLLQVCGAVAFAHSRLVVHRDLKPSNILVTQDGQVRLLDFGIAKLMEGDRTQETQLTQLAGRALTLDYASPEQIKGEPIGTTSDVYSLGVVSYELLTGAKPYKLKRGSAAELEEAIATADPPKASDAATALSDQKALKGDLDAILNKALKKAAGERYPTVDALAQDVQRHVNNEPVTAQPDSVGYRLSKLLARYRWQAIVGLAASATVFGAAGVALFQAQQAARERNIAQQANARAQQSQKAAEQQANMAREERNAALAAGERAEAAAQAQAHAAAEATRQAGVAARQTRLAEAEAERARIGGQQAEAVRDYLIGLFRSARDTQPDALKAQQTTALELIDRGVVQIDQLQKLEPEARLALLRAFSDVYLVNGRPDRGVDVARRVVAQSTEFYGSTALSTLHARAQLAHALGQMGSREEAVQEIESVLPILRANHPDEMAFALALRTSAGILQIVNPALALARIEEAVTQLRAQVARTTDSQERSRREESYAAALSSLGVMQQTGGKLRESVESLQAAIRLYDRLYGDRSTAVVSARSRLLYSLTVIGRIEEVLAESPKVIAGAAEQQSAPLIVPQARLYYGRALVLQGRFNDGRKQMELALSERSRFSVLTTAPRLDTFQGQVALIRVEQDADAAGIAELERLLAANAGVPATRLSWHAALMRAYRQSGQLTQALRHEAAARAIASSVSAFGDMRLQFASAAAPLYAVIDDGAARLNETLIALERMEQAAASDFERTRARLPRAQALLLANRSTEAAELLRPLVIGEPAAIDLIESRLLRQQTYAAASQALRGRDDTLADRCARRAAALRSEMQIEPTGPSEAAR